MTRTRRLSAIEFLPVVLALVLVACGGTESANTTTTGAVASSTTMAETTTSTATATTRAPATTAGGTTADLPTELKAGNYLVGTEILPGTWEADECGCVWATVDEMGNEVLGTGDDAVVLEDAVEIRLGSCNWVFKG
jgi:hypothetical protein